MNSTKPKVSATSKTAAGKKAPTLKKQQDGKNPPTPRKQQDGGKNPPTPKKQQDDVKNQGDHDANELIWNPPPVLGALTLHLKRFRQNKSLLEDKFKKILAETNETKTDALNILRQLSNSSSFNYETLKTSTLLDADLPEGGCIHVDAGYDVLIDEMLTIHGWSCDHQIHCGHQDCNLRQLIESKVTEKTQVLVVVACQRHQLELFSMSKISIRAMFEQRMENNSMCYINIVTRPFFEDIRTAQVANKFECLTISSKACQTNSSRAFSSKQSSKQTQASMMQ